MSVPPTITFLTMTVAPLVLIYVQVTVPPPAAPRVMLAVAPLVGALVPVPLAVQVRFVKVQPVGNPDPLMTSLIE